MPHQPPCRATSNKSIIPYRQHLLCKPRVKTVPQAPFASMANPNSSFKETPKLYPPHFILSFPGPQPCLPHPPVSPCNQCQCLVPNRHWKMPNELPHHGAQETLKIMSATLQVFKNVHKRMDFYVTILSQITTSQSSAKYYWLSIRRGEVTI